MNKLRTPVAIRYNMQIPELQRTISYRALTVGEQKALLTVVTAKDPQAVINCIVDIINAITFGQLDMSKVPMHLVDYIFLKSYTKSTGSSSKVEFSCGGVVEVKEQIVIPGDQQRDQPETVEQVIKEEPCNFKAEISINLDDAHINYPENYKTTDLIQIDEAMSVKLKLPDFMTFKKLDLEKDIIGISDQYIFSGIEYILDGQDMKVPGVDFTSEELITWINTLDSSILQKITAFFLQVPHLQLNVPVTCPNCGRKEVFELNDLEDFLQ